MKPDRDAYRTARSLIDAGRKRLLRHVDDFSRHGDERLQAEELLEFATGGYREHDLIDPVVQKKFAALLDRRATGEPVAYIRGFEDFRGMRLAVKPGAFIPRQSTEFLAEQGIRRLRGRNDPIAADLATGIGAVAIAIGREVPDARVYATDISASALRLARANARTQDCRNVRFLAGSMFDPLPSRLRGSIDVIASHPPYISSDELPDMPKELLQFEPVDSLTDASADGLGLSRVLVAGARTWLRRGGWLCIEIGPDLARRVRSMLVRAGYSEVKSTRGRSDQTRVIVGKR
jgi:release factor glutamine methyltransferase